MAERPPFEEALRFEPPLKVDFPAITIPNLKFHWKARLVC